MDLDFRMHAERTPNPQSIKWVLSKEIVPPGETANFRSPVAADVSPLAARLFALGGIESVFLASHFVTVTKREELAWTDLAQGVVDAIKAHVASAEPALGPAFQPEEELGRTAAAGERSVGGALLRFVDHHDEVEIHHAADADGTATTQSVFVGVRDDLESP